MCDHTTNFGPDACYEIFPRIQYGGIPDFALWGQNFTF